MIKNCLRACRVVTRPILLKRLKTTASQIDPAILKKLDKGYEKLIESNSKSLLKKHLTPDLFKLLRTRKGKTSTLLDCIQSGLAHHDSGCGVYAPEAEAYDVFADLFDPIIAEYHFGFGKDDTHPDSNFGNPCNFGDLDPLRNYIASTRIRCARSVEGFPFNPRMTKKQYDQIEDMVVCALSGMTNDLEGKYMPLLGMKKDVQQKLIDDHFLFKVGDRFLRDANANRYWPTGRGIYHNYDKTFVVWCNEEDHIRIISMQRGGDFKQVFSRLLRGLTVMERKIVFVHDCRLGYLTFCPTNLGTTIRASVHIRLPKLAANKKQLEEIANNYKLQVRGTRGEHSDAEGGIYDISNKRRLGITEYDVVKELYSGISEIIRMEKAEKGQASPKKEGKSKPTSKSSPKSPPKGSKKLVAKMGASQIIITDKAGQGKKAPLKAVESVPIAKIPPKATTEPAKVQAKVPIKSTPAPDTKAKSANAKVNVKQVNIKSTPGPDTKAKSADAKVNAKQVKIDKQITIKDKKTDGKSDKSSSKKPGSK